MSKDEFLNFVKLECEKNKIKFILIPHEYMIIGGIPCSGAFYQSNKLMVAINNEYAYEVLLHEYCHMLQWLENIQEWKNAQKINSKKFNNWFDGKNCKNIKTYIDYIIDLELENEKRSVKMIKKLNLDFIDIKRYIKKANVYIQFYNWVLIHRKWSKPGKPMHKSESILDLVPSKFSMNYRKIPKRLEKAMTYYYLNG